MNVDHVTRSLNTIVSEAEKGAQSMWIAVLLHEPTRRLWAEEDTDRQRKGRDECRPKLQAPRNVARVSDGDVCDEACKDPESCPEPDKPERKDSQLAAAAKRKHYEKITYCQLMTRAPRIAAGEFSAANIGTVEPFAPMPKPKNKRATKRPCQL